MDNDPVNPLREAIPIIDQATERVSLMNETIEKTGLGWEETGRVIEYNLEEISSLDDMMYSLGESMTTAGLKFDLISQSATLFASEFGSALAGSGTTFKQFMADMLMGVGQMLLAWGALALVTAYFGYGPGAKAALVAFAAGAAAILAAKALGGGSQAGGTGGSGQGAGYSDQPALAGAGGGGSGRQVTIVNYGVMLNNPDDFVRWMTEKQLRAGDR
jgi:hypothetical protein